MRQCPLNRTCLRRVSYSNECILRETRKVFLLCRTYCHTLSHTIRSSDRTHKSWMAYSRKAPNALLASKYRARYDDSYHRKFSVRILNFCRECSACWTSTRSVLGSALENVYMYDNLPPLYKLKTVWWKAMKHSKNILTNITTFTTFWKKKQLHFSPAEVPCLWYRQLVRFVFSSQICSTLSSLV